MSIELVIENEDKMQVSGFFIERTAKKIRQAFSRVLGNANVGVTIDQLVVMQSLEDNNSLSQKDIGVYCFKDAPTVTRIIDILTQKKLLFRFQDPNDRRKHKIELTDSGKQKLDEIKPLIKEFRAMAWAGLETKEVNQMVVTLNKVFKNIKNV